MIVVGVLSGPITMFSSTVLPGNLDFLSAVTSSQSLWFAESGGDFTRLLATGTLVVSPRQAVPEPGTLGLAAIGLAGALARGRRGRRSPRDR
jgi:hypothetical protein